MLTPPVDEASKEVPRRAAGSRTNPRWSAGGAAGRSRRGHRAIAPWYACSPRTRSRSACDVCATGPVESPGGDIGDDMVDERVGASPRLLGEVGAANEHSRGCAGCRGGRRGSLSLCAGTNALSSGSEEVTGSLSRTTCSAGWALTPRSVVPQSQAGPLRLWCSFHSRLVISCRTCSGRSVAWSPSASPPSLDRC